MLCAKKGMPHKEWEMIFHEQEERQRLRKFGISESLITDIISYTIRPVFEDRDIKEIGHCLSFDKKGKLTCTVCPKKPNGVIRIDAQPTTGDGSGETIIVAVLCESHSLRIQRRDKELVDVIVDTARQRKRLTKGEIP
jgi:hypothetical protein